MPEALTATFDQGQTPLIRLVGPIDRNAAEVIDSVTSEIIVMGPQAVVLDFADTGYINSSGIALIVGLLGKVGAQGVTVEAQGLSDHYRHVFEITRLTTYMKIRENTGDGR